MRYNSAVLCVSGARWFFCVCAFVKKNLPPEYQGKARISSGPRIHEQPVSGSRSGAHPWRHPFLARHCLDRPARHSAAAAVDPLRLAIISNDAKKKKITVWLKDENLKSRSKTRAAIFFFTFFLPFIFLFLPQEMVLEGRVHTRACRRRYCYSFQLALQSVGFYFVVVVECSGCKKRTQERTNVSRQHPG